MSEALARFLAGAMGGIAVICAAFIAIKGYKITHGLQAGSARTKRLIDIYDRMLTECVGPLLAHTIAAKEARASFMELHPSGVQTEIERKAWRVWLRKVLMEHNLKMEEILSRKGYALLWSEDRHLDQQTRQLLRHINFYKKILASWDEGDYSVLWNDASVNPELDFPKGFDETVAELHSVLAGRMMKLIKSLS